MLSFMLRCGAALQSMASCNRSGVKGVCVIAFMVVLLNVLLQNLGDMADSCGSSEKNTS